MANSFFKPCSRLAGGEISSDLYRDWLWDGNFKFCLIFTNFNRFSPVLGYIWWSNTLSSLENFSINSILVFVFLMSQHDNGGFLKNAQRRASINQSINQSFICQINPIGFSNWQRLLRSPHQHIKRKTMCPKNYLWHKNDRNGVGGRHNSLMRVSCGCSRWARHIGGTKDDGLQNPRQTWISHRNRRN